MEMKDKKGFEGSTSAGFEDSRVRVDLPHLLIHPFSHLLPLCLAFIAKSLFHSFTPGAQPQ
ncbi:MAG TPA: hypothetical protein DDW17_04745 [Deltaproteobacteria bacterium]|nr:hypothetical protein [Deltaproteobacteria bacterium]